MTLLRLSSIRGARERVVFSVAVDGGTNLFSLSDCSERAVVCCVLFLPLQRKLSLLVVTVTVDEEAQRRANPVVVVC